MQDSGSKAPLNVASLMCEKCKGGHFEEKMILCDRCDKGWHIFCISPALESVPEGHWICPSCIAHDFQIGARRPSKSYSLREFRQQAHDFEVKWYGSKEEMEAADKRRREEEFWNIVEIGEDPVEVICCSELDTKVYGSGFPSGDRHGGTENKERTPGRKKKAHEIKASPWNLNNMSNAAWENGNLTSLLYEDVPGMTAPTLDIGMLFSARAWGLTQHLMYTISYLHKGAPKKWYGIPSSNSAGLEAILRETMPDAFSIPDLLYDPQTMISPQCLESKGVPVFSVLQDPGTFILTFPNAYTASIDLGFNLSESLKIAPPDWLRFGAMSVSRLRSFQQKGAFCHDLLIINAAQACRSLLDKNGSTMKCFPSITASRWVAREMQRIQEEECILRSKLWGEGLRRSRQVEQEIGMQAGENEDPECIICRSPLHISALECDCCEGRRVCLHHSYNLCDCGISGMRLAWRYTLQDLHTLQDAASTISLFETRKIHMKEEESDMDIEFKIKTPVDNGYSNLYQDQRTNIKQEAAEENGRDSVQPRRRSARNRSKSKDDDQNNTLSLEGGLSNESIHHSDGNSLENHQKSLNATNISRLKQKENSVRFPGEDDQFNDMGQQSSYKNLITESNVGFSSDKLPVVQAYSNGFVQGPVRPFEMLEIYPEDKDSLEKWISSMKQACINWQDRARTALTKGGAYASKFRRLAEEAQQFTWGGAGDECTDVVAKLQPQLIAARDFIENISAALENKPDIESAERIILQDPVPVANPPGFDKLKEAVHAGKEWLLKFSDLAALDNPLTDIESLESAVKEASSLPVLIPEAESLRERLNTVQKIRTEVRDTIPITGGAGRRKRKNDNPITIEYLEELLEAATETNVEIPEARSLQTSIDQMYEWQSKAEEALELRASLSTLYILSEEAESFPVVLPQTEQIAHLIERAEAWINQSNQLLSVRTSLKKLRDLLHVGLRLPVEAPEVEALRKEIRKREWEESARKGANLKGTLHGLTEILNQANEMGIQDSQLAQNIQSRLDAALKWETQARAFCARFENKESQQEMERPTLVELKEIVDEGVATGVKMERLQKLSKQLTASNKWIAKASQYLTGSQFLKSSSVLNSDDCRNLQSKHKSEDTDTERDGVNNDQTREIAHMHDNDKLAANKINEDVDRMQKQCDFETSSHLVLSDQVDKPKRPGRPRNPTTPPPAPKYDNLAAMIEEYRNEIIVHFDEFDALKELKNSADFWLEEARPILEQDSVQQDQMPILQDLIIRGKATGVALEQVDILEANVEALQWEEQVKNVLALLPDISNISIPHLDMIPNEKCFVHDRQTQRRKIHKRKRMSSEPGSNSATSEEINQQNSNDDSSCLQNDEGKVEVSRKSEIFFSGMPPPDDEMENETSTGCQKSFSAVPYDQRPAIEMMIKLLEEGDSLPCNDELFSKFRRHVEIAVEWKQYAVAILAVGKDGNPVSLIQVQSLRQHIARGEHIGVWFSELALLYEVLRAYEKWESMVRNLIVTADSKPALHELNVFQNTSHHTPVTSNLRRHIDALIEVVEEWFEELRRLIAKRNSAIEIDECLDLLLDSVDAGIMQFERRLKLEKACAENDANMDAANEVALPEKNSEDVSDRYCLCQQIYSDNSPMINCDTCREWYHMKCVGLTQSKARSLRKFHCPVCRAVRNHMSPLEIAIGKLRKTKRPTRDELLIKLGEIKLLPVAVHEEKTLQELLNKYDRWCSATERAIDVHESSWRKDSPPDINHLSDGMLYQLCRSALAMEINSMQHAEKILHLLRCNRWRRRIEAIFSAAADADIIGKSSDGYNDKATIDGVARLLKEADLLEIDVAEDKAGSKLLQAVEKTREWQNQMLMCISDIKKSGKASNPDFEIACSQAKQLAQDALKLPISVERDVGRLKEYAKSYCLCKSVYDDQIPMLECDQCAEWYHFECVGLKAPGSGSTSGEEDLPDQFVCPVCCLKEGAQFPYISKLPPESIDALEGAAKMLEPVNTRGEVPDQYPLTSSSSLAIPTSMPTPTSHGAIYPPAWQFPIGKGIPFGQMTMSLPIHNPQAVAQMMEAVQKQQIVGTADPASGSEVPLPVGTAPPMGTVWGQYPFIQNIRVTETDKDGTTTNKELEVKEQKHQYQTEEAKSYSGEIGNAAG